MSLSWVSLLVLGIGIGVSHGRSPRIGDFSTEADDKVVVQKEEAQQLDSIQKILKNVATEEVTVFNERNICFPKSKLLQM